MAAQQNTSWGFLLRVAEATPAAEGRATTGVAPWVDDTGYFHWTPGHEAHGLACGPSESSAAEVSSEDRTSGRSRSWACTAVVLVGAVLLASTICMAASSNWMLLASAVHDAGTGSGLVFAATTTTTGRAAGSRRAGGLMFHRHVKVDGHARMVTDRGRAQPRSAGDVSSRSPGGSVAAAGNGAAQGSAASGSTPTGQANACGAVYYTYCPALRDEYRASPAACVSSGADHVAVCNRGSNRFASLEECYRACGLLQGPNRDACFEQPLFTACERQDVTGSWWYFDGHRCAEWGFPQGECPVNGTGKLHASLKECRRQCEGRRGGRDPQCRPPASATCEEEQLRFPYFARILPSGRGLCVRASLNALLTHRCLAGANRFDSMAACRDACLRR
nr:uncharacterized protein LOC126525824 [Dermacentor andersoni]